MSYIKLTDGSTLIFKKDSKKNRFLMTIEMMINKKRRKVVVHLDRSIMNWISLEIEELLNP